MRARLLAAALAAAAALPAVPASADPTRGCRATAPGSLQCSYYTETGTVQFTHAGTGGYYVAVEHEGGGGGYSETNAFSYGAVLARADVRTMHVSPGDRIVVVAYAGPMNTYSVVDVRDL